MDHHIISPYLSHLDVKKLLCEIFVYLKDLVAFLTLMEVLRLKSSLSELLLDSERHLVIVACGTLPTVLEPLNLFLVFLNFLLVLLILPRTQIA